MPNLSTETVALRQAQVLEIMALIKNENISQTEACERKGVSVDTFRRWVTSDPDALTALRSLIEAVEREQTLLIASAQNSIVQDLLGKLNGDTEIGELIAALKYLDKRQDELVARQNLVAPNEKSAQEYLQGPKLEKASSRMTVKANDDGSVDITTYSEPEIVDAELQDLPSEFLQQQQIPERHHTEENTPTDQGKTESSWDS